MPCFSQIKLTLLSHGENLLSSVLESACSGNRLDSPMSLHLYFRVLFPAADVHRHVIKGDLLFEELVHLTLNRILVTCLHKGGSVVDASHRVEVFMLA